MEILKVLMEDAGCEKLDEECLKNLFKLVEENKYPKLDDEEKKELDNELADQLTKHRFTNPSLAEEARRLGLEKTAGVLSGAELTEVGKPTLEEELKGMKEETERKPAREAPVSQKVVVVSKGSKSSIILSSLALIISFFTVATIFGLIRVPNLTLAKEKDLLNLQAQLMSLQTNYIIMKNELIKVSSLTRTEINLLKLKLLALNNTISIFQSKLTSEIEELKHDINKLNQRLEAQEELNLELASKIGNLAEKEKKLGEELMDLQNKIRNETESFKRQIKSLENKLTQLNSKLESLSKELEMLNNTVDTKIEKAVQKYEKELMSIQKEIINIKSNINEFEKKLESIKIVNKYITTLESKIKELSSKLSQIDKLNKELQNLRNKVVRLNTTVAKLPMAIEQLKEKQNSTLSRINNLEMKLAELSKEIENMKYNIRKLKENIKKDVLELLQSPQVFNLIYNILLNKYHLDQKIARLILLNNTAFRIAVENIATSVCLKMMQGSFKGLIVTG